MYYKTAHAACRGSAHIAGGFPCQDVTAAWQDADAAAIVLCDGAGSCAHALEGAEAVSAGVLTLLQQWCRETGSLTAEAVLYASLKALSRNPYPAREQSCTLLLCAVRPDGRYVLGHIGDGCGFLSDPDGARVLSLPENGENPNETYFVTGADALSHLRLTVGTLRPGETVLLCSDGAGASLLNYSTAQPAPAVNRLGQWLQDNPSQLVSQALAENLDQVLRSHSHDDMSIALLACCEDDGAQASPEEPEDPAEDFPEPEDSPWDSIFDAEERGDCYV